MPFSTICTIRGPRNHGSGPAAAARAYLEAPPPGVVLCANRLGSRREVEEAVVHELVHAYDYLVAGVELLDCQALAYRYVVVVVETPSLQTLRAHNRQHDECTTKEAAAL